MRTSIEASKEYTSNSEMVRTVPVPLGARKWTLRMSRDAWPEKRGKDIRDSEVIYGQVEISYDSGLTYAPGGGGAAPGGVIVDRNGVASTETTVSAFMYEPNNPNRVARVTLRANSRLTTKLDVDFD